MRQLDAAENWDLRIWGIILEASDDFAEPGEDLSLTEREFGVFCLVIKGDDHVLDLKMSEEGCQRRMPVGGTSSPQRSSSPCLSLTLSQVWRNWVMPCSLTWEAYLLASSQVRGVPRYRRPMAWNGGGIAQPGSAISEGLQDNGRRPTGDDISVAA